MNLDYLSTQHSYVAVLDIVGFKEELKANKEEAKKRYEDKLKNAIDAITSKFTEEFRSKNYNYYIISDTLILMCPGDSSLIDFLESLKFIFLEFLKKEIFIRGGIDFEPCCYALINAHLLEENVANYPRIVISKNTLDYQQFRHEEFKNLINKGLVLKWNNIFFLNVLEIVDLPNIYDCAKNMYNHFERHYDLGPSPDEKKLARFDNIFLKHRWFEDYILWYVLNYKDQIKDGKNYSRYTSQMELLRL